MQVGLLLRKFGRIPLRRSEVDVSGTRSFFCSVRLMVRQRRLLIDQITSEDTTLPMSPMNRKHSVGTDG